jgi:GAF domain-containing protein
VPGEEQAALRRVATLVARGTRPEEVFSAVVQEVGQLLPVDYAYLGRYARAVRLPSSLGSCTPTTSRVDQEPTQKVGALATGPTQLARALSDLRETCRNEFLHDRLRQRAVDREVEGALGHRVALKLVGKARED